VPSLLPDKIVVFAHQELVCVKLIGISICVEVVKVEVIVDEREDQDRARYAQRKAGDINI
jgi:hypothetical protein